MRGDTQTPQPEAVHGANRPGEQSTHSDAGALASSPGPHGTQAVCAPLLIDDWLRLTRVSLHIRHCIPSSLAVPGRQGWQKLRSPLGSRPAEQSTQVLWSWLATHCGSEQSYGRSGFSSSG